MAAADNAERRPDPDVFRRVLIATDGSECSRVAVEQGLALARALGAAVMFVVVRSSPPPVLGEPFYAREVARELAKAQAAADDAMKAAERAGLEADYEMLVGEPADEILALAKSRGVDLVVVGSRGRGRVRGALLGSVSNAVAHSSDCAVVVVGERVALARRRPAATRAAV